MWTTSPLDHPCLLTHIDSWCEGHQGSVPENDRDAREDALGLVAAEESTSIRRLTRRHVSNAEHCCTYVFPRATRGRI
jgi:hypothetical protein